MDVLSVSEEVSQVLIEVGFLIDQFQLDQLHKQDVSKKINTKVSAQSSLWNAANAFNVKLKVMETWRSKYEQEYTACEENIKAWEQ